MRDEIVAVANEDRAHSGLTIDFGCELSSNRENDVLLARATAAASPGIFAAMTGVDDDDDVASAIRRSLQRSAHDGRRMRRRQVDDETIAVLVVRRQQERLRFRRLVELEHEPQLAARPRPGSQSRDGAFGLIELQRRGRGAGGEIEDDALRAAERERAVLGGTAELEDDACTLGTGPDADVLDRGGARRTTADDERHGHAVSEPPASKHPASHSYPDALCLPIFQR